MTATSAPGGAAASSGLSAVARSQRQMRSDGGEAEAARASSHETGPRISGASPRPDWRAASTAMRRQRSRRVAASFGAM